jgi:hypothetical protein
MSRKMDLTGQVFGQLTVVSYAGKRNGKNAWNCQCSCGNHTVVERGALRSGNSKSCGCGRLRAITTHKGTYTKEYRIWIAMKTRCLKSKSRWFHRYGGRGITVCDRWLNSFASFFADMGPRPSKRHSIDRKDNDGPYSPENCRWATKKEQAQNSSIPKFVTAFGESLCIADWAKRLGVHPVTIGNRLRNGWDAERAVSTPRLHSGPSPRT